MDRSDASLAESDDQRLQSTLPEVMYSLACLSDLYEIGLEAGRDLEVQELRQHILTHIRRTVRASGACLLLYNATQQFFVPVVTQGDKHPWGALANMINCHEMEQLALRGPGETLSSIQLNGQRLVMVTLSYNRVVLGVIALAIADDDILQEERGLLLSYMGNVAALALHNYDTRTVERTIAVEQERNRIAMELHDGIAQTITYIAHKLDFVLRLLEGQDVQQSIPELERAATLLNTSLQDVHYSIYSLVPAPLEKQALADALVTLFHNYMSDHPGTEISTAIDEPQHIPARFEIPIFHFMREALANISKHAHATHITIRIRRYPQLLVVEVSDDGVGFQPDDVLNHTDNSNGTGDMLRHHLGMRAMRERVQNAGGIWEVHSRPGKGTLVRAQFSIASPLGELTNREREILHFIAEGLQNQAIAQKLAISHETVKTHVHHILQKLHVKDRTQAATLATRYGWL